MHVLLVTSIFPPEIGGPATYTYELARDLRTEIPVTVVAFGEKLTPLAGVRLCRLPLRYPFLGSLFRQWRLFRTLLREIRSDTLVYAQEPVVVGWMTRWACALKRRPYFLKFVGDTSWESAFSSEKTRKFLDEFLASPDAGLLTRLHRWIQGMAFQGASKIFVPSDYLKRVIEKHYHLPSRHIEVIPNAVAPKKIKTIAVQCREKSIVSVGRLVPWKNMAGVIRAFSILPHKDITLKIIGSGPEMPLLQALVGSLNLKGRVEFCGRLSHTETLQQVARSELFVLNSLYEGLPHTVLEAMLVRTPVIATAIPGTNEVAFQEDTALTVPPLNDQALAAAMNRLLSDITLRRRLATAAHALIMDRHVWSKHLSHLKASLELSSFLPRVLMLSNDEALLHSSEKQVGDTLQRFQRYAEGLEEMLVLVPTQQKKATPLRHGKINIIPCEGRGYLRFYTVYREAVRRSRERPFDLVVTNDAVLGWIGARLKRRWASKLQISVFGLEIFNKYWLRQRLLNRALAILQKQALRQADTLRSDTQEAKRLLVKHLSIPKDRIFVIPVAPSAQMIQKFSHASKDTIVRNRYGASDETVLVLSVTALDLAKNVPLLIEAAAQVVSRARLVRFLIVGDGPQRTLIEQKIHQHQLKAHVFLLGKLPYEDLVALYASSDLFVLPSLHEGFARVLMEAAFARLPIVATEEVMGACDIIVSGESGLLVSNKNPSALAEAILELVSNPARRRKFGEQLYRTVASYCNFERCVQALMESWKATLRS